MDVANIPRRATESFMPDSISWFKSDGGFKMLNGIFERKIV